MLFPIDIDEYPVSIHRNVYAKSMSSYCLFVDGKIVDCINKIHFPSSVDENIKM